MSEISKQYYPISEDEMQELIRRSKSGDNKATSELLEMFQPYLNKYLSLLYYGKYDLKFYDIRKFLHLFVKDKKVGYYLMRNKVNPSGREQIAEVVKGLKYMVNRYCTIEDVKQTIDMTFLRTLDRYEPTISERDGKVIPFSAYIYSYYFYLLSKQVKIYMIDQLGRKTFPLITDDDMTSDDEPMQQGYKVPLGKSAEDEFADMQIDEFWVIGETAMWPFTMLEIHERQLLKWRYNDRMKYNEIALKIAEHPNTCREHISKIRAKVKRLVIEDENMQD